MHGAEVIRSKHLGILFMPFSLFFFSQIRTSYRASLEETVGRPCSVDRSFRPRNGLKSTKAYCTMSDNLIYDIYELESQMREQDDTK